MAPFDTKQYGSVAQDVTYATVDGQALQMDIYFPPAGGPWKGLVFVHGGGWTEGDKAPLALDASGAGYLAISINYRLYPAYRFPAMIEDVKSALRYLRAHAAELNLDPERIALVGHSAGAHLAALAGLAGASAGWDGGPHAEQSSQVQAVVAIAAPTDLERSFPDWVMELKRQVFGPAQYASASPVKYAHREAPPFLIVHGDADPVVPVEQAGLLEQALQQAGARVEKLILHNGGHGLEAVGGEMSPSLEETFAEIMAFLARSLGA